MRRIRLWQVRLYEFVGDNHFVIVYGLAYDKFYHDGASTIYDI